MVKVKDLEEVRAKVAATMERQEGIAADVLRVLAIHHGAAWRSELLIDLAKFYRFQAREGGITGRSVDSAVRTLMDLDLVSVEERTRGSPTTSQTYVETLIRLRNLEAVRTALLSDAAFARYSYHRQQAIRDGLFPEQRKSKV